MADMSFGLEFYRKLFLSIAIFIVVILHECSVTSSSVEKKKEESESHEAVPDVCVNIPKDLCPSRESDCLCVTLSSLNNATYGNLFSTNLSKTVLCCHISEVEQLKSNIRCALTENEILALHVRNSSVGSTSLSLASEYLKSLTSLAITDGTPPNISRYLSDSAPNISCLNLSRNGMSDLPEDALKDLHFLQALDLSSNNVTKFPQFPKKELWIDISGNRYFGCSEFLPYISPNETQLEDLDHLSIKFHNKRNTSCISSKTYDWFNWIDRTTLEELEGFLEHQKGLQKECPSGKGYTCFCTINRIDYNPRRYSVAVDCSGRNLTKLPLSLPPHTVMLNVSNNRISSLELLGRQSDYKEIRRFDGTDNLITSIEVLEGSEFLKHFQVLLLSGNKLKELPMYILQGFFEDTNSIRYLNLGSNDYSCNCQTFYGLMDWLIQNKKYILDLDDIVCTSQDPHVKITSLKREMVCFHETDWLDYMYVVVLAEIVLLIALITKVTYDYWIFKTKGYLPWPASQTPKMPCFSLTSLA
ncbi:hypothetical protein J437_LFUL003986 [Ladona fulva]|uniref:LRRNT domain-containing protein n=1 Tax=Ladona fulva TaxID=123851 RepID=A0A8K0NWN3_LADFU|nr:hypothetical protein J437_LFUL003986 [Ladona fulva]